MRKIPSSFQLLGHTITVEMREDLQEQADCWGRWTPHKHLIELQVPDKKNGITYSFIVQTFWHEVTHAILDNVGQSELSGDEGLVDLIGQCIYQVLKTKKGSHQ